MSDVLKRLLSSIGVKKEKHFLLLVGPRGSGKTHCVALAYHRLCTQLNIKGLTKDVEIAFLNEEEWGVASYLDFLVRILKALANDLSSLNADIEEIYAKFATAPDSAESFAESTLSEYLKGKTLLLICENLVDLFAGLDEEGQRRWRAFIQQTGFWTILATTPVLFSALTLQDHPFYGFFTIRRLEKLGYEEALDLLVKKSIHDGRSELAAFLGTPVGRARIRAVHHLAGGNHRAYVLLYDFLDKQSLDDLIDPFMEMVDDLTPYYQDKMRQLPPAQRKIVECLCQNAEPVAVKDIAARCLMSQQTAAKQLGELMIAGFVQKSPIGRQTFCEIAEPLMRICIEVKDNRTEHFRLFVEFLRHWFSNRELEQKVGFLEKSHRSGLDRIHLEEAIRCSRSSAIQPFFEALQKEGMRCLDNDDFIGLAGIYETLVRDRADAADYHWYIHGLREAGNAKTAEEVGLKAIQAFPNEPRIRLDLARVFWKQKRYVDALAAVDYSIGLAPDDRSYHCFRAAVLIKVKRFEDAIAAANYALKIDPQHYHSYEQIMEALTRSKRIDEAAKLAQDLALREPSHASILMTSANFYYSQRDFARALELLDRAVMLNSKSIGVRYSRGLTNFEMRLDRAAREDLEFVVAEDRRSIDALCRLSDTLMRLKDYPAAIETAQRLLKVDPKHWHAYLVLGAALAKSGQSTRGMAVLLELRDKGDADDVLYAAEVALDAGEMETSRKLIESVLERQQKNPRAWEMQGLVSLQLGDIEAARLSLEKAKACGLRSYGLEYRLLAADARSVVLSTVLEKFFRGHRPSDLFGDSQAAAVTEGIASAMATSLAQFGPAVLPEGTLVLQAFLSPLLDKGYLGQIFTILLSQAINDLHGSLDDWEPALEKLEIQLKSLQDCRVPLAILSAAVRFTKTRDERYLLQLPLEQRQLLKTALLKSTDRPSS